MKKGIYRSVDVKQVRFEELARRVSGQRLVVSLDVAKEKWVAALVSAGREVVRLVRWQHPEETRQFVDGLLLQLPWGSLEVAAEPSGSYGDSILGLLRERGVAVYRVSPKRSHDAAEVYDGVASWHDPKSAAIIARLHLDGASEPWPEAVPWARELKAAVRRLQQCAQDQQRQVNRLEAVLARHWPEVPAILGLGTASLVGLLRRFGGPQEVAAHAEEARRLLRRLGGARLKEEKIEAVLASARTSLGVPLLAGERQELVALVREIQRLRRLQRRAQRRVEELGLGHPAIAAMGQVVGQATAGVVVSALGEPAKYRSAASYEKAAGLNLKERSSGQHKGELRITKRGPAAARRALYWAALRLIQEDALVQLWYRRKVARDGGKKGKAIVAVMRKLLRALYWVAQGEAFEASLLFDVRRLREAR